MNITSIYQTLEDRNNCDEIESHGPYLCSQYDSDRNKKKGIQYPWLGEGYYFWDTRIEDARWWGNTIYWRKEKGYIVCQTQYDQHSPLLLDLVGNLSLFDDFVSCAQHLKRVKKVDRITFPAVLAYLKKQDGFNYKAVRAWPDPKVDSSNPFINILFPGGKAVFRKIEKVQICFFDKTLLQSPFKVEERRPYPANFTI